MSESAAWNPVDAAVCDFLARIDGRGPVYFEKLSAAERDVLAVCDDFWPSVVAYEAPERRHLGRVPFGIETSAGHLRPGDFFREGASDRHRVHEVSDVHQHGGRVLVETAAGSNFYQGHAPVWRLDGPVPRTVIRTRIVLTDDGRAKLRAARAANRLGIAAVE